MREKVSNIELKDLVELHLSSIREEIKGFKEMSEYKFDEVITHQKITNGRVTKLDCYTNEISEKHVKEIEDIKEVVRPVSWATKNKKILLISVIVGWFALDILSKSIELIDLLNIVK